MNITLHLILPNLVQLTTYIVIGIIVTLLAGAIIGMRSGFGFLLTTILAAIGAWVFTSWFGISVVNDFYFAGIPLIRAMLGAIIFGLLSILLFSRRRVAI